MSTNIYDHAGDGTYELITWKYDEGTFVKHPTTTSIKLTGTYKVGERNLNHPHMVAIKVVPF